MCVRDELDINNYMVYIYIKLLYKLSYVSRVKSRIVLQVVQHAHDAVCARETRSTDMRAHRITLGPTCH